MDRTRPRVSARFVTPVVQSNDADRLVSSIEQALGVPVTRRSLDTEPPAAGLTEIAAVIGLIAGSGQLAIWLYQLSGVTNVGRNFRSAVQGLMGSRNVSRESGRRYIPLALETGTNPEHPSVRFYFHGQRTEEEIAEQLEAAAILLQSVPPEALSAFPGPQEYGFFWDSNNQQWRGRLYALEDKSSAEPMWWPHDLKIG